MRNPQENTYMSGSEGHLDPKWSRDKIIKKLKKPVALYLVAFLIIISMGMGILIGYAQKKAQIVTEPGVVTKGDEKYGQVTGKTQPFPEYFKNDIDFSLFWEVWDKIQTKYIGRPMGETKMLYGAMSGLVASLEDPYSVFFTPEPAKEFTDDLSGKFEGIGAEIGIRDNILTIISPLPESPAEAAGLKAGDKVIEIDGQSTEKLSLNEAVLKIRGEKGTTVLLKIFREDDGGFRDISISRDVIKIVSVRWEMKENNIAYIRITSFNQDTESRLREAVEKILLKNPKAIILDLRSNPGGYLDQAVDIASYWLDTGKVVVQEEFSDADKTQYLANGQSQLKDFPTIVLVNRGSASGSEIVAGALQDYGAAKLVGETTFGKGSVQSLEELSDGSAVKLTIARWLTPNGRQIDVDGLEPDEKVELTEEDFAAGNDPQLDRAIEILNNK